ncbi:hypothetical protein [Streptomyces sp. NPDC094032]|uniref:hypothetical protein n=1 Tax=Streptomyces sp. NPDC094032 TaxID=3155308 RepID=UPI003327E955
MGNPVRTDDGRLLVAEEWGNPSGTPVLPRTYREALRVSEAGHFAAQYALPVVAEGPRPVCGRGPSVCPWCSARAGEGQGAARRR